MDETTLRIIDRIVRNFPEKRSIPSGHLVDRYYSSVELTTGDLSRLAAAATGHLAAHPYEVAVAAGLTGVFFAVEAANGGHIALLQEDGSIYGASVKNERVILVDDVVCSGKTLLRAKERLEGYGANVIAFTVIVDRLSPSGELDGLPVFSAYCDPLS
jgi:orotate phosphoribosyltransferase